MKSSAPGETQPPRLPKRLPSAALEHLEDDREYLALAATNCDLTGQRADGVLLEQVQLRRVLFTRTHLLRPRLADVRCEVADFSAAEWENARLRRVEFNGCRLLGFQWIESDLEDVLFRDCNLEGVMFISTRFKAVRFEGCNLRGASFEQAGLARTGFRGCDLSHAILRESSLQGADLRGATLNGMQLAAADLQGAVITPQQAPQVVALLGVRVLDEQASLDEDQTNDGSTGAMSGRSGG